MCWKDQKRHTLQYLSVNFLFWFAEEPSLQQRITHCTNINSKYVFIKYLNNAFKPEAHEHLFISY